MLGDICECEIGFVYFVLLDWCYWIDWVWFIVF